MGHIIYILLLTILMGTPQRPDIHTKVVSSHWSLKSCIAAAQEEAERIGSPKPPGVKLECIEVEGKISW